SPSVADHPLRPATDHRLGGPLPHQLANRTSANPIAPGLAVPGFPLSGLCGINPAFAGLSPTTWTCSDALLTRSPLAARLPRAAARLACVKHSASVQSEPGSNSSVQSIKETTQFESLGSKVSTTSITLTPRDT